MARRLKCYFCKTPYSVGLTRVVNYKIGRTGKRGTYRRRICDLCEPAHQDNIRYRKGEMSPDDIDRLDWEDTDEAQAHPGNPSHYGND